MSFKMKFEALQPIGYGDYESGLAEGRKQGIEQGKVLGVQQGVSQTNAEVLVLTGTEQPTATQAIAEINATLATNLTAKGVQAEATETTDALADKVGGIKNPQDAYKEGYDVGLADGKASASWIEQWAKQCTTTGRLWEAELGEVGDLHFEKATEITNALFYQNLSLTKIGNITALKDVSSQYGEHFGGCKNLTSVGDITINLAGRYKSLGSSFSGCSALKTVGFINAPLATGMVYLCASCTELETFGGFNSGLWTDGESMFNGCKKLREITHPIDFTSCGRASAMFKNCVLLEYLRFVAGSLHCSNDLSYCTKLSAASWESVFYGLADLTGQTACTITVPANPENQIPQSLKDMAVARNWSVLEA